MAYLSFSSATGRFWATTLLRPGSNLTHEIWQTSPSPGDYVLAHRYWENGRTRVGSIRTAMVDRNASASGITTPRAFVFGTRFLGGGTTAAAGAIRMVRNDYFVPGQDQDQDGLSFAVEQALGSCDRPSQTIAASTFACSALGNCAASPSSPYCLAALRDTDHDGLRDDVEVYGLNHALLLFPLWGADPAHADLFVEMDTYDQDPPPLGAPLGSCEGLARARDLRTEEQGGTPGTEGLQFIGGGADFFGKMQAVFDTYPARYNPDGRPGIALHWDVGVPNPNYPTDTRWGAWGGGNTCLKFDVDTCGYMYAWDPNDGNLATRCNLPEGSPEPMHDLRKPFFRYGVDGPLGATGQAKDVKLGANGVASWAHELMHTVGLAHGGPAPTAGAFNDHNFRPQYTSRINYRYATAGGALGYRDGIDGVQWFSRFGFSDGSRRTLVFPNQANETCTFGMDDFSLVDPNYISVVEGWFEAPFIAGGCASFDWNHDGDRIDTGVRIVDGPFSERIRRWTPNVETIARPGRAAVVALGSAATGYTLVTLLPTGANALQARFESDNDCEEFPVDRPTGGGRYYPPCFVPGPPQSIATSFPVHGVGAAPIAHATNNALVVLHAGSGLHFATMRAQASPPPLEGAFASGYTFAAVPGAPAPRNSLGSRDVSLHSLNGGSNVLLAYLGSSGTRAWIGRYVTSTGGRGRRSSARKMRPGWNSTSAPRQRSPSSRGNS